MGIFEQGGWQGDQCGAWYELVSMGALVGFDVALSILLQEVLYGGVRSRSAGNALLREAYFRGACFVGGLGYLGVCHRVECELGVSGRDDLEVKLVICFRDLPCRVEGVVAGSQSCEVVRQFQLPLWLLGCLD